MKAFRSWLLTTVTMTAFMACLSLLTGCTHWELTRGVHAWGADPHELRMEDARKEIGVGHSAEIVVAYARQDGIYIACKHTIDGGHPDGSRSFLYCRNETFANVVDTVNWFRHSDPIRWEAEPRPFKTWDVVDVPMEEARKIINAKGYICWRTAIKVEASTRKPSELERYRTAYAAFEGGAIPALTSDLVVSGGIEAPSAGLVKFLALLRCRWQEQPLIAVVAKSPLWLLTVPGDIVTGPFQTAWDGYRGGP